MLKVGIIGCGTIAQVRHIPELANNQNCQLTAYYSATPQKAEKMAEKADKKKIATAAEILEFLTYAMNDENAEYKDRIRAAELSGKRLGIFKDQIEMSGQAPLVIIDDA